MIYFDNAATSRPFPEVVRTYADLCTNLIGNPSSANGLGTKADEYLEKARKQIAASLGLTDFDLFFTSGATESNNDAILGYARRHKKEGNHLITSQGEHASVINVFKELEKEGFEVTYLPLDKEGRLPASLLKESIGIKTILVSLMGVNNEVGTIYPLEEYASVIKKFPHVAFMSDLTQAIGKVDVPYYCLDMFTMSSHKVGGLKSSGLLAVKKGITLDPIFFGGGQEAGERPGTVNVPLACSLATALRIYLSSKEKRIEKAKALSAYLRKELLKMPEEIMMISPEDCCPFIMNFAPLHVKASVLVEALSSKEIYVSTRSACSSKKRGGSSVVKAMGYPESVYDNAIRLSFEGDEEIQEGHDFLQALSLFLKDLKRI